MKIMTLNMHCGMEVGYEQKFQQIITAIIEEEANVIVLQECPQPIEGKIIDQHRGVSIKKGNLAYKIVEALNSQEVNADNRQKLFDYYFDWGHYSFGRFEEGLAIITNLPIVKMESRYVSQTKELDNWCARKIIRATLVEKDHLFQLYSIHLGWWDDQDEPAKYQVDQLLSWDLEEKLVTDNSLFVGDFNMAAGSLGYAYLTKENQLSDLYLSSCSDGFNHPTLLEKDHQNLKEKQNQNKRIDHIMARGNGIKAYDFKRIFTPEDYGYVSDHIGLIGNIGL